MKKIFILAAVLLFLLGCAAKKPVVAQKTAKEEVVVEVDQNADEQTVMLEDITPVAQEEEVVEEVVIRETGTYIVNPGDNLYSICLQKNLYIWQLAELNGIENPSLISIGKKLILPAEKQKAISQGNFYKVDIGDNLSEIAEEVNKSQDELVNLNNLSNRDFIKAGSLLRVN